MEMIIKVGLIIFFFGLFDVPTQIAKTTFTKSSYDDYASNIDWVKHVTQKYSPDSWNLLLRYESLPLKQEATSTSGAIISAQKPVNTFHFLKGKNKTELLLSMSTNVHEISHAYFRHNSFTYANERRIPMRWDNVEGFIYLSPVSSFYISFPRNILFPSNKLVSVIPDKMKTFRYNTYIKGNSSTQSEGIIGLLNELHAYYLGSKYTYQMLEAYKISEGPVNGFYYWVSHLQSNISAYYEFDFFIKEYLLYMKSKYPASYELLKSDKSFRMAYASIMSSFGSLIEDYRKEIAWHIKSLNKSGKAELSIENNILWVWQEGNKTKKGTAIFSEDKEKIVSFLKTDRYKAIERDYPL